MNTHVLAPDIPRRRFLELGLKSGFVLAAGPGLLKYLEAAQGRGSGAATAVDPGLLSRAIRKGLEKGGDFAEVYLEKRISRSILLEEGKFKSAVFGISQGAGVRVLSGDKTGYAYTDELSDDRILRAAEIAAAIAQGGRPAEPVDIQAALRPSALAIKVPLQDVSDEKRLDIMRRAHQAALDYDKRIVMASIDYYDEIRGRTIANSEGLLFTDERPLLFFIIQTLGSAGGASHMGRERISAHSGFEMFDGGAAEKAARTAARESIAMLEAKDAPAGRMDVVMPNGWGGVLVHEAVGHPLEADNIAKQIGAFTGKLGRKVASPLFTMVDDGSLPGFRGSTGVDDEGTPMKRNVLIQDGVLLKYMTDVLSARQIKADRTGNGRRESFRFRPIPRMTNTFIAKGHSEPADILASTKSGLYVQALSGGSVNPITGVFNFTCREAYRIENGRKTHPVKGATLIGSCLDVIRSVDAVGNDLDFGPGICGKGQSAEVSAGQPTVRLRGINVGGTRAAR
jgi:TldD protein